MYARTNQNSSPRKYVATLLGVLKYIFYLFSTLQEILCGTKRDETNKFDESLNKACTSYFLWLVDLGRNITVSKIPKLCLL